MPSTQNQNMPADADRQQIHDVSGIRTEIHIPAQYPGDTSAEKLVLHEFFLIPNEWQNFRFQISDPGLIRERGVEIIPICESGLISISNIRFIDQTDDKILWSAHDDFSKCIACGDTQAIYHETGIQIICSRRNCGLKVPAISNLPDWPLIMDIWIRPDHDFMGLSRNFRSVSLRLEQESGRNRKLLSQIKNLELQIQKNNTRIRELNENRSRQISRLKHDLHAQKTLTSRYFNELAAVERLLEDQLAISARNKILSKNNKRLVKHNKKLHQHNKKLHQGITNINNGLQALSTSARWKTGNVIIRFIEILLLRRKQPQAVDRMRKTLLELKQIHKKLNITDEKRKISDLSRQIINKKALIRLLYKNFQSVKSSLRWKVGHFLVRGIEILTLRPKQLTAVDRLQHIFEESGLIGRDSRDIGIDALNNKISKINYEFKNIKRSNRWKAGDSIFSFIDILLLRRGKPTSMDHALKLLAEYEKKH